MHVNDYVCEVCGAWCAASDPPLVVYLVAGTPPGYVGPPVDLNARGVQVPTLVRELMAQPVARREWCVPCFAKAFGLALVEAQPGPLPRPLPQAAPI
jgi:hypothetical protein